MILITDTMSKFFNFISNDHSKFVHTICTHQNSDPHLTNIDHLYSFVVLFNVFQDVETSPYEPVKRDSRDNTYDELVPAAATSAAATTTPTAAGE